jgi:DNA invertase Pin-like site-specific DNA recombinase
VRLCTARIAAESWTAVATYSDHGISGASSLRPGYQKLLEDARAGAFDVVAAEALDRLTRDQEHIAALYKQLGFAGIRLVTLSEGEIGELHVGLKGTMNALFLKDLALKTRRGLEGRVRQGRSGGGLCYGYDVVREVDAAGNPVPGGRRINSAEAAIFQCNFESFAAGLSPRAITGLPPDPVDGPSWRSAVPSNAFSGAPGRSRKAPENRRARIRTIPRLRHQSMRSRKSVVFRNRCFIRAGRRDTCTAPVGSITVGETACG